MGWWDDKILQRRSLSDPVPLRKNPYDSCMQARRWYSDWGTFYHNWGSYKEFEHWCSGKNC